MNKTKRSLLSTCFLLCVAIFSKSVKADEECIKSLKAIGNFRGISWHPAISIRGNSTVETDEVWKFAVKKFTKSGNLTSIQIKESDSSPVIDFNFKAENNKFREVKVSKNNKEDFSVTLTSTCQIDQIQKSKGNSIPASLLFDRELCNQIAKKKINTRKINECRDVFAEIKTTIAERNNNLAKVNQTIEEPKDVDGMRPYLQILTTCDQLQWSTYSTNATGTGAQFSREAVRK